MNDGAAVDARVSPARFYRTCTHSFSLVPKSIIGVRRVLLGWIKVGRWGEGVLPGRNFIA